MKNYYSLREIEMARFNVPKHINKEETTLAEVDMFWYNLSQMDRNMQNTPLNIKFENAPIKYDKDFTFIKDYEPLADEFAIGFAEWMAKEYWLNSSGKYLQGQTHEELLQIYKKENGL